VVVRFQLDSYFLAIHTITNLKTALTGLLTQ
jgi:hypothetical protein